MEPQSRDRILEAAARVYAQHGFRGATTRRIADEAGVNEITVFRHFGSKEVLINEALRCSALTDQRTLPDDPQDPEQELTEWAINHIEHLRACRSLIRKTMGEWEERPEAIPCIAEGPITTRRTLLAYLQRLEAKGIIRWRDRSSEPGPEPLAATTMLMSALFTDAVAREMMPELYLHPAEDAPAEYVRAFLRAIGANTPTHATTSSDT
jgi:AcrR family transcriptional regulator